MFEQWKKYGSLGSHMETEHFKAFGAAIKGLLVGDIDITIYSAKKYGVDII